MDLQRAREVLASRALDDPGSFYGSSGALALGLGLLVKGVEYPFFDQSRDIFSVRAGLVYVLSHECDLDPSNERFLNGMALICPIIPLGDIIEEAVLVNLPDDELGAFLGNIAVRRAIRCVYMPPVSEFLPDGGLLNLNLIASTAVSRLEAGQRIAAISPFGLRTIDAAIEQHLRREKSDRLPLSGATVRKSRTIYG